jgi:hypothetical protein
MWYELRTRTVAVCFSAAIEDTGINVQMHNKNMIIDDKALCIPLSFRD